MIFRASVLSPNPLKKVETSWRQRRYESPAESQEAVNALHEWLRDILKKIQSHKSAWPFLKPVSKKEVPDYYDHVKDPIDLETMQKRLETGQYYITREIFLADIKRMCDNCRGYNGPDNVYYDCAEEIEAFTNSLFIPKQAEQEDSPDRGRIQAE